MQRLFRNIALFAILTLIYSCKRTLDAGIKTTVSGTAFDYNSQKAIPDVPIYIYEFKKTDLLYPPRFNGIIDSTKSGLDGKYAIDFTTTGHGSEYRIVFKPSPDYYLSQDAITIYVGKDQIVDYHAFKLHVLKARLQINENPNPPLRVSTIAGLQARIWGTNNDTIVLMKILPNQFNQIQFTITNVDTPSIYNYRVDTLNFPGFQDTFNLTIPLAPKTFPKRG